MTWSKGQPWRVVRSLDRLNAQIRAAYPRAVPPATAATAWGSIADSAHTTSSDHYPHYYGALGSTAVVCARDFPHAPKLGLDAHALAERLRLSRDPRIGYVISNGRITGPSHDWEWDDYDGSDPHDTHIHVSTVHTAAADDPRDWKIGKDDDMPTADEIADAVAAKLVSRDIWPNGYGDAKTNPTIALGTFVRNAGRDAEAAKLGVAALRTELAKLTGADLVNEADIVAGVLAGLTPEKIAAAIPPALTKQVADELAKRLVA